MFNVSNDDHSVDASSDELIATYYKGIPVRGDQIPASFYSNAKAKRLLGFQPEYMAGTVEDRSLARLNCPAA